MTPQLTAVEGTLKLEHLSRRGLQLRAETSNQTIASYAEAYLAGEILPPVVVFQDGDTYHLADGHHRVAAARRAGLTEISVRIAQGDRRAAILYAAAANGAHGLPLTNADKRRIVETMLADAEWRDWSNCEIARHAKVSEALVRSVRKDTGTTPAALKRKDGTTQSARGSKQPKPDPNQQTLADIPAEPKSLPERRLARERDLLCERISTQPGAYEFGDRRTVALLVLIVGIDTDPNARWNDDNLATSLARLDERFTARVTAELRAGNPRLPDLATIARTWALDPDALRIQAERDVAV